MWSEICSMIPLITGLDSCIEHDIQEIQNCIEYNKFKGYTDQVVILEKDLTELKQRKQLLDNMNPIIRWIHCELQYRKEQRRLQQSIKENRRKLEIWN